MSTPPIGTRPQNLLGRVAAAIRPNGAQAPAAQAPAAEQPNTDTAAINGVAKADKSNNADNIRRIAFASGLGIAGVLSGGLTGLPGAICGLLPMVGAGIALTSGLKLHGKTSFAVLTCASVFGLLHGITQSGGTATFAVGLMGAVGGAYLADQFQDGRAQKYFKGALGGIHDGLDNWLAKGKKPENTEQ